MGKLMAGFPDASWDEVKSVVVVAGTIAKIGQNLKLKGKLIATGDRLLVEAALGGEHIGKSAYGGWRIFAAGRCKEG